MPDRDLAEEGEQDVAHPTGFSTSVDGRPVAMQAERRALLRGRDVTGALAALKLPVLSDDLTRLLDALPRADRDRLVAAGLARVDEYDAGKGVERHLQPGWTVKETWFWRQSFPAGATLRVEHRYTPGTGGTVDTMLADPRFAAEPDVRRKIARYCIDESFLAGVGRLRAQRRGSLAALPESWLSYILTTGAYWGAPIGSFRLVVEKGAPDNLVSFCGDGIRKISPTRFEMRKANWRPERDLHVLIVGRIDRAD